MTTVHQMRISWTGLKGLPGVSTFYCQAPVATVMPKIRTFFESLVGVLPSGLTITYPTTGSDVDTATGDVIGTWSAAGNSATLGTATGSYAAPAGAAITWHTGLYLGGRELRGRTFIVPMALAAYQTDGTLFDSTRSAMLSSANTLATSIDSIAVWSRSGGAYSPVTSATISDKVAVLRSRRA